MVSAGGVVHARRAAKFAHRDDERLFVEAAIDQIADQRGEGSVERRQQQLGSFGGRVAVRGAVMIPRLRVDRDERHAPLDQSPSEQSALAEFVAAIGIARRSRFGIDVERFTHLRSGEQVKRGLIIRVEVLHRHVEFTALRIERREQAASVAQPVERQVAGE